MADTPVPSTVIPVSDEVQEQIHFDTLWAVAQNSLAVYAGQRWTAREDDDPGVTLLQAFTYGVSDISYRHTLPLTDLLTEQKTTPTPGEDDTPVIHLAHPDSIFAHEFGPERALTSSPVTLADYRRAILDLVTANDEKKDVFCFRDVQIALCPSEGSYGYTFDAEHYAFQFLSTTTPEASRYQVSGRYQLWVTLTPGVKPENAMSVLQAFLKDHRNLCEWEIIPAAGDVVQVNTQSPEVRFILDDDLPAGEPLHRAVAQAIWAINQALLPLPVRESATQRLARGESAEQVYTGPRLEHGWTGHLPPGRAVEAGQLAAYTIPVQHLSAAVNDVPGIRAVTTWFSDTKPITSITVPINQQVQLWVDTNYGERLLNPASFIQLYKRGQRVSNIEWIAVSVEYEAIKERAFHAPKDALRNVPYGRNRHPEFYRTIGASLPPVYGLQQAAEVFDQTNSNHDADARQLLLFLRPFEQLLANRADQLKKLPRLLAFDGREPQALVWGSADWPRESDDPLAAEQTQQALSSDTLALLNLTNTALAESNEKELAILDYLLGYFGEQRASRTLSQGESAFRHVQQGFLRQVTRLAYERASISISKVSALQRKIAARLGVGEELFDERLQKPDAKFPDAFLPFYLVEHQELLPVSPTPDMISADEWPAGQGISGVYITDDKQQLGLSLEGSAVRSLRPGQLIELQGTKTSGDNQIVTLAAIVIHEILPLWEEGGTGVATILLEQHTRLKSSLMLLQGHDYQWQWRVAQTWLKRVVYNLIYTQHPEGAGENATLNVSPSFPVELMHPGQRFALRPKGRWQSWPTRDDLVGKGANQYPDIVVEVVEASPLPGTVKVKWVAQVKADIKNIEDKSTEPPSVNAVDLTVKADNKPDWSLTTKTDFPYAWSVPYLSESFSFTLSLVLNREWLKDSDDAAELNQWIESIAREEMPSHLNLQLHWLDDFGNFAGKYKSWQDNGRPVGDQSYELLRLLGIGERPVDSRAGIGFVHIANRADSADIEASTSAGKYPDPVAREKALQQYSVVYVRAKPETEKPTRKTRKPAAHNMKRGGEKDEQK